MKKYLSHISSQLYTFNTNTLEYEVARQRNRLYTFAVCGVIFLCVGFSSAVKINTIFEKVPVIIRSEAEECNEENVKSYIAKLHLSFPEIVYQQTVLESGHYTSNVFKTMHNLTGMKVSGGRPTLGRNNGNQFAEYDNWKESLVDYALWQAAYTRDIKTSKEYYEFLDKIYCARDSGGTKYSTKLKQIK